MAVATTTRRELTEQRLKKIGVFDRFDYVLCGDEVTKRKPNPEIYETVLKKMGVTNKNALVLEDSVVGVEAAYRAGIDCIQVPDLIAPTEVQEKQTICIVRDLTEARDYIKEKPSVKCDKWILKIHHVEACYGLAIPSMIAQLVNILYSIVDRMFVGRLKK